MFLAGGVFRDKAFQLTQWVSLLSLHIGSGVFPETASPRKHYDKMIHVKTRLSTSRGDYKGGSYILSLSSLISRKKRVCVDVANRNCFPKTRESRSPYTFTADPVLGRSHRYMYPLVSLRGPGKGNGDPPHGFGYSCV